MKEYVGLWIDSGKAIIVTVLGDEHSVMTLKSHVDRIRPAAAASAPVDCPEDGERSRCLQAFYVNVLGSIGDPCRILILGPDAAKEELAAVVRERRDLALRLGGVEGAPEMSAADIARRIRLLFEGG
jgi:hypothetical protein